MTDDLEVVQKGTLNKMLAMQIRIEKLEAANLKQSCIKVDDEARIEKARVVYRRGFRPRRRVVVRRPRYRRRWVYRPRYYRPRYYYQPRPYWGPRVYRRRYWW